MRDPLNPKRVSNARRRMAGKELDRRTNAEWVGLAVVNDAEKTGRVLTAWRDWDGTTQLLIEHEDKSTTLSTNKVWSLVND